MAETSGRGFVVDSWAWIEYLRGSATGESVRAYIEGGKTVYTSSVSISEIVSKFLRSGADPHIAFNSIISLSNVVAADAEMAAFAGELHAEAKKKMSDFGLADAFVLATARVKKAKILTGDPHFKNFPEAILITQKSK